MRRTTWWKQWVAVAACVATFKVAGAPKAFAAETAGSDTPVLETFDGPYVRYELTFPKALNEDESLRVFLHSTNGVFKDGWAQPVREKTASVEYMMVDARTVTVSGTTIKGAVGLRVDRTFWKNWLTLEFQATIQGPNIVGQYTGVQSSTANRKQPVSRTCTGALSGVLRTDLDMRRFAIPPNKDYASHRGPLGNGSGYECGRKMIADRGAAGLLWRADQAIPGAFYGDLFGGYGSPIVYESRVYLYYFETTGDKESVLPAHEWGYAPLRSNNPELMKMFRRMAAQDVIVCFDGATGRTLWKHTIPGGVNMEHKRKRGHQQTPCAARGKVFVHSALTAKVYAFDAKTGKILWENAEDPLVSERLEARRKTFDAGARVDVVNLNDCPQVADGVLFVSSRLLRALDLETGSKLWDVAAGGGSPTRWTHQGKEYLISGGAMCLEPKTGKILWKLKDPKATGSLNGHVVDEDHLVTPGHVAGKAGMTCFKISPTNAPVQMWSLDPRYSAEGWHGNFVIYKGHAYAVSLGGAWNAGKWFLFCVNLETGKVTSEKAQGRFAMSYGPAVGDGLMCGEELSLFKADPSDFALLPPDRKDLKINWRYAVGSSLAYADGRLFFRSDDSLLCFDLRAKTP